MIETIIYFRNRKSAIPVITKPTGIQYTAEVFDYETNSKLNSFWLYLNGVKYEVNEGIFKTKIKEDIITRIRYYAIPTEEVKNYYVPEDYEIRVRKTKSNTFSIRLTATNENGEPLQNANVTVEFNGEAYNYTTNEDGQVYIADLPKNTDITITIEKDNEYIQKTIVRIA